HRAGFASRVVADAIDLVVAWLLGLAALLAAGVIRYLLTGPPLRLPVLPNWLDASGFGAVAVVYLGLSWAATGRAVGQRIAGRRGGGRGGGGHRQRGGQAARRAAGGGPRWPPALRVALVRPGPAVRAVPGGAAVGPG